MKRWQIGLIGCTLLILFSGGALAQPADIAPNHWAYKAVQTLVQRGYMDVAPDGNFGGDKSVQRYDLAVALAHLLSDIEAGRVQISAGADVDMLRELEREFRAELVQWYAQRDQLEAAHGHTQRQLAVIDEQLNLLLLGLDELHMSMRAELATAMTAEAMRTDELFEATNARIGDLQELVLAAFGEYGESIASHLDEQVAVMASLRQDLERQAAGLVDIDQRLNRVNDHAAALVFRLNELERIVTGNEGLADEVHELRVEVSRLQDVLGTSEEQIARMTERVRTQLDDQLALSLSRERQLERQLRETQAELEGYKAQAGEEIRSARNMGTMAIGVGALAVLLSLMN